MNSDDFKNAVSNIKYEEQYSAIDYLRQYTYKKMLEFGHNCAFLLPQMPGITDQVLDIIQNELSSCDYQLWYKQVGVVSTYLSEPYTDERGGLTTDENYYEIWIMKN